MAELAGAGVKRITLAKSLYRAPVGGLLNAACEVEDQRTFGYVDARSSGPLATARAAAVQMSDLLATARLIYSPRLLDAMDRVSRRWLERSGNPFCKAAQR